jgi:hypothetical protein
MNNDARISLAASTYFTAADYVVAQKIRIRLIKHLNRIFKSRTT